MLDSVTNAYVKRLSISEIQAYNCNGLKTSKLRHSMPCIKMPEVAYLYRYLLVSARENTPE